MESCIKRTFVSWSSACEGDMDLYYLPLSTPCRSVIMTADALGIKLNKKLVAMQEGEHLKPEFLKLNPQHTIPTLVDNGFSIWESRAIIGYLVEKYGKTDSLYPKNPEKRALVNQRLFFDLDTLNQSFANYFYPQIREKKPADPELFKKLENALTLLNTFLEDQEYVAGDTLTVADISILCTLSAFVVLDIDIGKYANVKRWYDNTQKVVPGWEESWQGALAFKDYIENLKNQAK